MRSFTLVISLIILSVVCSSNEVVAQRKQAILAFASDTQEPMWIEKLWHKVNHNLQATQMIFTEVTALHPQAFFILGDVVSLGKSEKAWKNIDRYIAQMTQDSIPVYATLGNHDVMFNSRKGTAKFKSRFPAYRAHGYTVIVDSVAVVLVNSNFSTMTTAEISQQNVWYGDELNTLDGNPAVKLIIVGCHHSPYTNSKTVSPSVKVQQNFVSPFLISAKGALFLSGHSHNYEQFKVQGKNFVVIGGGGGLHQRLKPNNDIMHDIAADYKPAFHYLEVRRKNDSLEVLSRQLKPDVSGFIDGAVFTAR